MNAARVVAVAMVVVSIVLGAAGCGTEGVRVRGRRAGIRNQEMRLELEKLFRDGYAAKAKVWDNWKREGKPAHPLLGQTCQTDAGNITVWLATECP
jgi:hypothetical protein